MYTTISVQFHNGMPAPQVVSHNVEEDALEGSQPFEIVRLRADGTQIDIFMGWDDVSAAEQALVLIEAFTEARNRALHRLVLRDAEWAAALPFDAPDPIDLAKAEEDRVAL